MASRSRIHRKYRQKRKVENHQNLPQIIENARESFQNRPKMGPSGPPDPPNSAVRRTTCHREAPRSSKDAYQAPKLPSEAPKRSRNANNLPRSVLTFFLLDNNTSGDPDPGK